MKHMPHWMRWAVLAGIAALAMLAAEVLAQSAAMSFFVTSTRLGKGADLGGLAGADRHCQTLATSAGAGRRTWRAYLSTSAFGTPAAVLSRGCSQDALKGTGGNGMFYCFAAN